MNKYRNFSLQKKLVVALILCIVFPLTVIGIVLNVFFSRNIRTKEYQLNQMTVNQVGQDLEQFFKNVEDLKYYCLTSYSVQDIVKGKGDANDYSSVGNWMEQTLRNDRSYYSVSLLNLDKNVKIQRGQYLLVEDQESINRAQEMLGGGFWTGPHTEQRVAGSENDVLETVISYYCGINDYEHINKIIATLAVNLKESEVARLYSGYMNHGSLNSCIVDEKGTVISSVDKSLLGEKLDQYKLVRDTYRIQGDGYITTSADREQAAVFYVRIPSRSWYLVNIVPTKVFMAGSNSGVIVILLSLALCVIFGIAFALIQKRYIISPILRLLEQIGEMKKGNFLRYNLVSSGDEIGVLNREFDDMSHKLQNLIEEVYTTKIKEQEAELKMLISQINPHFLYNTLDSIHWMAIKNRDYEAGDQLEALSEIFRHVLSRGREMVTLQNELDFLQNYILIMQARFGSRVKVHVQIPEEMKEYKIPKLLIQPLVENAILHGLEPKKEGGLITVTASRAGAGMEIAVEDNGVGADEEQIRKRMHEHSQLQDTFALCNIDERIKLKYGKEYGLHFESQIDRGCRVTLMLPVEEKEVQYEDTADDRGR
ncbi:cache domain-containing sensor histidine kinase [Cuneatibacter caecimuris]|uniref:Two-component system sensor histidine kinase YesM n=1 Tax=Cuneatibacter caecimuris TaxID=1796618 RepID=A0A4Q7PPN6_9FIRM|nr:sensor histidine kinase [Cuneatibacter caecimuris]RZT02981.1 two-component system sensor histidine kinase YesM [Cuneatibacter caecimuris]